MSECVWCQCAGVYQVALALAVVVYQGRRLSQALQTAIAAMVTSCVQKQMDTTPPHTQTAPGSVPPPLLSQELALQGMLDADAVVLSVCMFTRHDWPLGA